ncbi:hypothetical protein ACFL6Y_03655 [Elusimicrobiota bacterium]
MIIKRLPRLALFALYALAFIAFLFPVFNPDIFWHLASARKAQELGALFLSYEAFSFTRYGAFWVNYEWLFQKIMWLIYKADSFRGLAIWRAVMMTGILLAMHCYVLSYIRRNCGPACLQAKDVLKSFFINVSAFAFMFTLIVPRASEQPELFTLLLLILFFFLRDTIFDICRTNAKAAAKIKDSLEILTLPKPAIPWLFLYCAMFVLWSNIHGGFVLPLGILGIQGISRLIALANFKYRIVAYKERAPGKWSAFKLNTFRELSVLTTLGVSGFLMTMVNPYGAKLYYSIFKHLKDSAFISNFIMEWQPSQFYDANIWLYWALFLLVFSGIVIISYLNRSLVLEDTLLVFIFALFAFRHVRHVTVFSIVALPIFFKHVVLVLEDFRLAQVKNMFKGKSIKSLSVLVRLGLIVFITLAAAKSIAFMSEKSFVMAKDMVNNRGIPRQHTHLSDYPVKGLKFISKTPRLLELPVFVEWGWGGLAIFLLHDKGLRTFFDGRYLFHDLLDETMRASSDPDEWNSVLEREGVDLVLISHPPSFVPKRFLSPDKSRYDTVMRSWHGMAFEKKQWALVWWDEVSLMFIRRGKMPLKWIKEHEYTTRFPIDPYITEYLAAKGKISIAQIQEELVRNSREAGWHKKNKALLKVTQIWSNKKKSR